MNPFFGRYDLSDGPARAEDALRVHLLFRSPAPEEAVRLRRAACAAGVILRETPEGSPILRDRGTQGGVSGPGQGDGGSIGVSGRQAIPAGDGWGGVAAETGAGPAAAVLLSGESSTLLALVAGLRDEPEPGESLARDLEHALFPREPASWPLRTRDLRLDRPLVMGIVNVTPDSFSDGGRHGGPAAATRHGRELLEAGADLLDVGGESTRPGADRVGPEEEERRVLPVVEALAALGIPVSVDTTREVVARRALAAGAEIVNDVSALRFEPGLARAAAEAGAGLVLMHMRGTPETMQRDPRYQDVAGEVLAFLGDALARAEAAGVARESCAVDPGIGFGKRSRDNEEILYRMEELRGLGRPLLVGPSRKGFLDPERRHAPSERLPETVAAACLAAAGGARILRVHDAGDCRRALDVVARVRRPAPEA